MCRCQTFLYYTSRKSSLFAIQSVSFFFKIFFRRLFIAFMVHLMVQHTQTIHQLLLKNCSSVFDHFVRLVLKGLSLKIHVKHIKTCPRNYF